MLIQNFLSQYECVLFEARAQMEQLWVREFHARVVYINLTLLQSLLTSMNCHDGQKSQENLGKAFPEDNCGVGNHFHKPVTVIPSCLGQIHNGQQKPSLSTKAAPTPVKPV